jgi:hypothetical protein
LVMQLATAPESRLLAAGRETNNPWCMCVERTRCFCKPGPKRLASSRSPSSTMFRGIVDASPSGMHPEALPPKEPSAKSTTAHRPPTSLVIFSEHNSDGPGRQYLRPRCRKESYAGLRRKISTARPWQIFANSPRAHQAAPQRQMVAPVRRARPKLPLRARLVV